MEGWIKLHREMAEKPIWLLSSPEQKAILITILLYANHESKSWEFAGKKFKCNPGQFVTSLQSLAEKSGKGITIQNVRSAIKRFEKLEFLTDQPTKQGRLITVVNWGEYQLLQNQTNIPTNKEVTKSQQRPNKDLTTTKECKNERMKEKDIGAFRKPTLENVMVYCQERGNKVDPNKFFDFYESKGWMVGRNRMKDWKAAIRNWERSERESIGQVPKEKPKYNTQFSDFQQRPVDESTEEFDRMLMMEVQNSAKK